MASSWFSDDTVANSETVSKFFGSNLPLILKHLGSDNSFWPRHHPISQTFFYVAIAPWSPGSSSPLSRHSLSSSHTVSIAFCWASDSRFTTLWNFHDDAVDKNPSSLLYFWHAQYSTVWFEYEVSPEGSCVEDLAPRWWCYWQECSSNPLMSSYRMGYEEAGLVAGSGSLESRIWRRYLTFGPSFSSFSTSWLPQTCLLPPFLQDGFALSLLSKTWN